VAISRSNKVKRVVDRVGLELADRRQQRRQPPIGGQLAQRRRVRRQPVSGERRHLDRRHIRKRHRPSADPVDLENTLQRARQTPTTHGRRPAPQAIKLGRASARRHHQQRLEPLPQSGRWSGSQQPMQPVLLPGADLRHQPR
jgi:hypothetical protein